MYYVYVIQNQKNRIYIGQTNNLEKRLNQHNDKKFSKKSYTKIQKGPWKLIYKENYLTRQEAEKREKALKSHKGRDWLREQMGP